MLHIGRFATMVAGMGFEPHDLRVMSPMSYQTALPRDNWRVARCDNYISGVEDNTYIYLLNCIVSPLRILSGSAFATMYSTTMLTYLSTFFV